MACVEVEETSSLGQNQLPAPETGLYCLRSLFEDVPLSTDGDDDNIEITCVEFLDCNLYVGTSASEILHFVQILPDPHNVSRKSSYILASRLAPAFTEPTTSTRPGVQQILLLPKVNKACVLCNWTATFFSLPELSPVFGTAQIRPCNWIGGIDLNADTGGGQDGRSATVAVLVSLSRKMRVVKIGNDARSLKTIDFAGSTISIRRDSIACVANSRAYALLDVDRQLKIPLFPISSLGDVQSEKIGGRVEDISGNTTAGVARSISSARTKQQPPDGRGHGRSTSLGTFMTSGTRQGSRGVVGDRSGAETPEALFREGSPAPSTSPSRPTNRRPSPEPSAASSDKSLPPALSTESGAPGGVPTAVYLKPHVVSPTPQEFLLVTGTGPQDPGVGMFVNLEGDVTRSTLAFSTYPDHVVVDGRGLGVDTSPATIEENEEGYVLAAMSHASDNGTQYGLEIQRWDLGPGEGELHKYWLQTPSASSIGLRSMVETGEVIFEEVADNLQLKRFHPCAKPSTHASITSLRSDDSRTATALERVPAERELFEDSESLPEGWEEQKNLEERNFAKRLGLSRTRLVAWSKKDIWWVVRMPMALQLEARLPPLLSKQMRNKHPSPLDRRKAIDVLKYLEDREPKTESEFLILGYIRQRAGLLVFLSGLDASAEQPTETEYREAEEALFEGSLDPRVIISLVPGVRNEIVEGKTGIWIHGGVKDTVDSFISSSIPENPDSVKEITITNDVLQSLRRYLSSWRRKKGFGSVSNENEVFRSVDAALLIVLLQLDTKSAKGPARSNSVRADLNELIDHGVDCFERAILLLESHNRLYVLSRLYQSRKMAGDVLATWRRILEGETDDGGEFRDGEQRVRDYLIKIRNAELVEEYGVWLASRNPKLGVRIFAEDPSQVKFKPVQVVELLRQNAPAAVKEYLEYLVFKKSHTEYINELIAYYLDVVTNKLEQSEQAKATLKQTYEAYRALRSPKPTYRQFITDNKLDEEWWHSRHRLLQLLGGRPGPASNYNVAAILKRIEPFAHELVPEIIILHGRQANHQEALGLLTHRLGDYDTAIDYCLLGGSSIYHPISGNMARDSLPTREQQAKLFGFLLAEFLHIEDISNRVEQTGGLLERFGGCFDVSDVLGLIPDTWSVGLISGFLVNALRRMVRERNEAMVAKSLSAAENLKISAALLEGIEAVGPTVEAQQ